MGATKRAKLFVLVLIGVGLAVVWFHRQFAPPREEETVQISSPNQSENAAQSAWRQSIEEHFAFDKACAECHAKEYEAHQRSGHSRTAVPLVETPIIEELLETDYHDPRRDQVFRFQKQDDLVLVGIDGVDSSPVFPIQWLLGSGTHARTPVSIDPRSGFGVEFRWTWFAHSNQWDLTPDHQRFDDYRPKSLECFGRPLDAEQALACMGCHMTVVPSTQITPTREAFVPNVGCERCHGPRKKHVELAHQDRAGEAKPVLTYDDPETYIRHCAKCHRDESNVPQDSPPNSLARYQPYGLLKSRCYLKSEKTLTCSNCHDPHDHAAMAPEKSLQACANCHSMPEQVHCKTPSDGDCLKCHMPLVEWQSGIGFHDHWIRTPQQRNTEIPASRTTSPQSKK